MIVSECEGLSPGVVDELQACVELGKADRTVLILPSPPFEFVGNEKDVQGFPRAMHQHELDPKYPARSVVFRDLIGRIARIAKLDPKERHTIEAVVDRLVIDDKIRVRLSDSVETALKWGEGILRTLHQSLDERVRRCLTGTT